MTVTANKEGDYILRAQAYAQQAGNEPARMEFRLDGNRLTTFDVPAPGNLSLLRGQRGFSPALLLPQPQFFEFKTRLSQGEHQFTAAFINAFSDPANSNPNLRTRNLVVRALEVASLSEPALMPPMSETMQRLFFQTAGGGKPTRSSALILDQFAFRAWRRPVEPQEARSPDGGSTTWRTSRARNSRPA